MQAVIILAVVFLFVGIRILMKAWRLTNKIERRWVRSMARALIAAVVFSPAIVPDTSLHGMIPLPAALAVVAGINDLANGKSAVVLVSGLISIVLVFVVVWLIGLVLSYARDHHTNAE
jgi:hypothetical protein